MTRLGKQLDRLVHRSWLSAALSGRFSGSGAIFSGNELDKFQADADAMIKGIKTDAVVITQDRIQKAADDAKKAAQALSPSTTATSSTDVSGVVRDAIITAVIGGLVVYFFFRKD